MTQLNKIFKFSLVFSAITITNISIATTAIESSTEIDLSLHNSNMMFKKSPGEAAFRTRIVTEESFGGGGSLVESDWDRAYGTSGLSAPTLESVDENNVNILGRNLSINKTDLTIGKGKYQLTHALINNASYFYGFVDNFVGYVIETTHKGPRPGLDVRVVKVNTGRGVVEFTFEGDVFTPFRGGSESLVKTNDEYIYTDSMGGVKYFTITNPQVPSYLTHPQATLYKSVRADGYTVVRHLKIDNTYGEKIRTQSVTTNNGLQFWYNHAIENVTSDTELESFKWYYPIEIVALNNAYEQCAPNATNAQCSLIQQWQTANYRWDSANVPHDIFNKDVVFTVTDGANHKTDYFHELYDLDENQTGQFFEPRIVKIKNEVNGQHAGMEFDYSVPAGSIGNKVSRAEKTGYFSHGYSTSSNLGGGATFNRTGNIPRNIEILPSTGNPYRSLLSDGSVALFDSTRQNKVSTVILPSGAQVYYSYDDRGNITRKRSEPKEGSTLSVIEESVGFDVTCQNVKTCNKPNWVEDGKGNRTEYEYHPQSGGVAKITKPANKQGIVSVINFTYKELYARYKNVNGNVVQAETPIWVPKSESYCLTGNTNEDGACAIEGDKVSITFEYRGQNGINNLFRTAEVISFGGKSQRTCFKYDRYGNVSSITKAKGNGATCS